ncbi:MAG TPA: ABC transporter ATP-binding protein, partial [Thermodesulfobacteriota bacterium]|nr:ABC transporter ATP-binding protein [Thermodesulfobacteriota bacterium]
MLKINKLNASYGVIPVLHDVEMEVREGEIVALLGGNGSGKTTLLNTVSGVMKTRSGTITFLDREIADHPADKIVQTGIAQIPEGRKIFPYLSVKENLLMGACVPKAWKQREAMLDKVCTLFPILKERAKQRASLMSGGEQQMLVIARGLMAHPKLLMIDEPSLGLSPLIMSQIYEVIKTFPAEGITVLLSE